MEDFDQLVADLADAATLGSDETTEWWTALTGLHRHIPRYAAPEFVAAYIHEVRMEYERLSEDFEIVTVDRGGKVVRELRHVDEL